MSKRAVPTAFEKESGKFCAKAMAHIRLERTLRGWSQTKLAEQVGLHQEVISAMERFPRRITVDRLFVLLRSLGYELVVRPARQRKPSPRKKDTNAHAEIQQQPRQHQD